MQGIVWNWLFFRYGFGIKYPKKVDIPINEKNKLCPAKFTVVPKIWQS